MFYPNKPISPVGSETSTAFRSGITSATNPLSPLVTTAFIPSLDDYRFLHTRSKTPTGKTLAGRTLYSQPRPLSANPSLEPTNNQSQSFFTSTIYQLSLLLSTPFCAALFPLGSFANFIFVSAASRRGLVADVTEYTKIYYSFYQSSMSKSGNLKKAIPPSLYSLKEVNQVLERRWLASSRCT
jgi:hypothetical protein